MRPRQRMIPVVGISLYRRELMKIGLSKSGDDGMCYEKFEEKK
jgi:hypothetical protein